MSKGSKRRKEDTNKVRNNWDNIDWSKGKDTLISYDDFISLINNKHNIDDFVCIGDFNIVRVIEPSARYHSSYYVYNKLNQDYTILLTASDCQESLFKEGVFKRLNNSFKEYLELQESDLHKHIRRRDEKMSERKRF